MSEKVFIYLFGFIVGCGLYSFVLSFVLGKIDDKYEERFAVIGFVFIILLIILVWFNK